MLTDVLDAAGAATATSLGANARFLHHDVTREAEWQRVVTEMEATLPVYVLINNASTSHSGAIELAPFNIRVNSVHPGIIRTPMMDTPNGEAIVAALCAGTPAGRIGEPDEVSSVVLLLASDESRFTTGAEFAVDGGMSCQ